jgi:hypothetical protein
VQELLELLTGSTGFGGGQGECQRMIGRLEQLVEILRIGRNELQLAIDQWTGVQKTKSLEEELERSIAPDMFPPTLTRNLRRSRGGSAGLPTV